MTAQDNDKSLKELREHKQFEDVADNTDDFDFEPDNMSDTASIEDEGIVDIDAKLEFQSQLSDYIFRGVPMKDMPVLNTEVYFGAIDQARKEIIHSGEGIYAPSSREGRAILKDVCTKLKSPDFDAFQQIETGQLVDIFNASPASGFYFEKQADGSFVLQPREQLEIAGEGEGLRQENANTASSDNPNNDAQPDSSFSQGR